MPESERPFCVLLISPDRTLHTRVQQQFLKDFQASLIFHMSQTVAEGIEQLKNQAYHVILADPYSGNGEDIAEILREVNGRKLQTPVILLAEEGGEAQAHAAIKLGASDYWIKSESHLEELSKRLWGIFRNFELARQSEPGHPQIESQNQQLFEMNEKLRQLSIRDELTGLYNHRYLQEKLVQEFNRAIRYGHPLSCLLLDLDHFRRVNDHLGHRVGDEVLKEIGGILLESCRLSDLIARFGGEEFIILLPHIDYPGALEMAERVRQRVAEHTFLTESHQVSLTVSVGVSCFPDDHIRERGDLLNFSDRALFRAKASGRNRVFLYRNLLPTVGQSLPHLKISEEKVLEFQKRLSEIADTARRAYIESSKAMIMALESKDRFTAGHSGSVARLSRQVAEAMGLPLDESEVVEHAGLLHDIGKICIADEVLLKPGRYTLAEYEAMKHHPYLGYRIVKPVKFLQQEATLVLHHHEWYNGQGYPCRLTKKEIPLGARIVAVLDSYDTMRVAGGRYKKTMSVGESVNELIAYSGTQFDPEVVQAFVQVLLMRKDLSEEHYNKNRLLQALESVCPR